MIAGFGDDAFRNIFDGVNDGILISDPVTGMFIEANAPACAMFSYTKEEILGRDIGMLSSGVAPYTLDGAIKNAEKARLGTAQIFEWQSRTKDGHVFWTEISIRYTRVGATPAIIAIVRDIKERRRLAEELRAAVRSASEANRAKSEFLASMSHELRTPLNAIIGFSDLILTPMLKPLSNFRRREYITDIHNSGLQLLALINDLLDLSRIDAGKVQLTEQNISLRNIIAEACRMVELQAKRASLAIVTELPAGLASLRGDERRIMQIILNLLSNAIKFTPAHGIIRIQAEQTAEGLVLKVSDTGIGIAAKDLPVVLERFGQIDSSLSRKHKGTGLGLALVKELVELHGGSVRIDSQLGVGTVVRIDFPPERIVDVVEIIAA